MAGGQGAQQLAAVPSPRDDPRPPHKPSLEEIEEEPAGEWAAAEQDDQQDDLR